MKSSFIFAHGCPLPCSEVAPVVGAAGQRICARKWNSCGVFQNRRSSYYSNWVCTIFRSSTGMLNARDLLERGAPPFFFPAFWWRVLRGGIYIMIFLPPVRIRLTRILAGMLPYYNQLKVRSLLHFSRLISPNSLLELSHSASPRVFMPPTRTCPLFFARRSAFVVLRAVSGVRLVLVSLCVCACVCARGTSVPCRGAPFWRACPVFSPFASSLCDSGYPPPWFTELGSGFINHLQLQKKIKSIYIFPELNWNCYRIIIILK